MPKSTPKTTETPLQVPSTERSELAIDSELFKDEVESTNAPRVSADDLAAALRGLPTAIVEAVQATQPRRKLSYPEWKRTRSVHRDKPALKRDVFQHAIKVTEDCLHKEEILMLNKLGDILLAGKVPEKQYINGLVTCFVEKSTNGVTSLHISWNWTDRDVRMKIQSEFRNFKEMLNLIFDELHAEGIATAN